MDVQFVLKYLRLDENEDEDSVLELIEVSEAYIDSCCGEGYKTDVKGVKLATLVQKKLITDMYENRTPYISDKTKRDPIVLTIFDKLSLMNGDDST